MGELSKLPNIGKEIERQLNEVRIRTFKELEGFGAEGAWLKIQAIDDSACYNRLLGLEGAILGIKKALMPEARKAELKEFYNSHKIRR